MPLTKDTIHAALAPIPHPAGRTLADHDAIAWIAYCDRVIAVKLALGDAATEQDRAATAARVEVAAQRAALAQGVELASLTIDFVNHAGDTIDRASTNPRGTGVPPVSPSAPPPSSDPQTSRDREGAFPPPQPDNPLPQVKNIIAVGAGKGGVGKSTVAVNLAVGLARKGAAVGLLDGDIYGPSLPTMLGLGPIEQSVVDNRLQPFLVHGVKAVTLGKLVDPEKPLIWRGPMAHGAFNQLVTRTDWGELDHLIIDLPPGTGDVPLTMAQSLPLAGAVIVCTPQRVAQDDAVRAANMFTQLGVDVLGVVENMSFFIGDDGKEYDIFGCGGAQAMAQRLALPFLGAIPINMALRANGDSGEPTNNFNPTTAGGDALPAALESFVNQFEAQLTLTAMKQGTARPTLSIK